MGQAAEWLQEALAGSPAQSAGLQDAAQRVLGELRAAAGALQAQAESTLFGQGVEALVLEAGKLGTPEGLFDDGEIARRLEGVGVPEPLTGMLARLLDLEFTLAEDGAPGIVALLLLALAAVGIYSALKSAKAGSSTDSLPASYDPDASAAYFKK